VEFYELIKMAKVAFTRSSGSISIIIISVYQETGATGVAMALLMPYSDCRQILV